LRLQFPFPLLHNDELQQNNEFLEDYFHRMFPTSSPQELVVSFGLIGAEGEILFGSGGYAIEKLGGGGYIIKWTKAKPSAHYVCVVSPVTSENCTARIEAPEAAKVEVLIQKEGAGANKPFAFVAIASAT